MNLDPQYYWLIAGVILILLEVSLFGFGLLFLGIGAISVYFAIEWGYFVGELYMQAVLFLSSSALSWVILWKPLKMLIKTKAGNEYKDMVGKVAKVAGNNIKSGKTGYVVWSGVKFRASIADGAEYNEIQENDSVEVVDIKGNTLKVRKR